MNFEDLGIHITLLTLLQGSNSRHHFKRDLTGWQFLQTNWWWVSTRSYHVLPWRSQTFWLPELIHDDSCGMVLVLHLLPYPAKDTGIASLQPTPLAVTQCPDWTPRNAVPRLNIPFVEGSHGESPESTTQPFLPWPVQPADQRCHPVRLKFSSSFACAPEWERWSTGSGWVAWCNQKDGTWWESHSVSQCVTMCHGEPWLETFVIIPDAVSPAALSFLPCSRPCPQRTSWSIEISGECQKPFATTEASERYRGMSRTATNIENLEILTMYAPRSHYDHLGPWPFQRTSLPQLASLRRLPLAQSCQWVSMGSLSEPYHTVEVSQLITFI